MAEAIASPIPTIAKQGPLQAATTPDLDVTARSARFVISTPTPDRSEDVVEPLGIKLENFRKNPVVYFDHGMSGITVPIGKCEDANGNLAIKVTEQGVEGTVYFANSPEGDQIFELVEQGILRASSINMQPIKASIRSKGSGDRPGLQIDEWELLEFSVVGIPDNPEAVRKVLSRSQLAGKTICAPLLKCLRSYASRKGFDMAEEISQELGGENIRKDNDDNGDLAMSLNTESSGGSMVKPEGARHLEKSHAYVKSAQRALENGAAVVEHPQAKKCMAKIAGEMKGHAADLRKTHKDHYPQVGEDAFEAEESDRPLASKSAVLRLSGEVEEVRSLHTNSIRKLSILLKHVTDANVRRAIGELKTEFDNKLNGIYKSLESIHEDSQAALALEPAAPIINEKDFKELANVYGQLNKEFGETVIALKNMVPHRRSA